MSLAQSGGFIENYMTEISKAESGIKAGEIVVPTTP
jgi:hypothetical protein